MSTDPIRTVLKLLIKTIVGAAALLVPVMLPAQPLCQRSEARR